MARAPLVTLANRVAAATGADPACCVDDLVTETKTLRADATFATAVTRAKAAADEQRLASLVLLAQRDSMCACEFQAALEISHATVSHHMGVLVDAGLVTSEKRGKWVHYALTDAARPFLPEGSR